MHKRDDEKSRKRKESSDDDSETLKKEKGVKGDKHRHRKGTMSLVSCPYYSFRKQFENSDVYVLSFDFTLTLK